MADGWGVSGRREQRVTAPEGGRGGQCDDAGGAGAGMAFLRDNCLRSGGAGAAEGRLRDAGALAGLGAAKLWPRAWRAAGASLEGCLRVMVVAGQSCRSGPAVQQRRRAAAAAERCGDGGSDSVQHSNGGGASVVVAGTPPRLRRVDGAKERRGTSGELWRPVGGECGAKPAAGASRGTARRTMEMEKGG
ncbi:hypothetical protein J5N97_024656 [Dioscorea zingiberensis]|uniref:Uncharacterized protein n=1 Tax=Dioscorea zingiberensis TaxID=325984 RepID=A0A9D5C7U9_9LILI|nr:hypothetical protein J5N97_024656 [Dioscorea zingiberensis]